MELLAHHLAATVVAVYLSKYHRLRGVMTLTDPVRKEDHIILGDPAAAFTPNDPEVLMERAVIDLAGHEAEHIYHIVNSSPDNTNRLQEHEYILNAAVESMGDLSVTRSELVMQALELVSRNWFAVRDLSRLMLISENGSLDTQAAVQRLEKIYGVK